MGKVCLDMAMSLDGLIAGRNDEYAGLHDWFFKENDDNPNIEVINELKESIGAIVMGRRTYNLGDKEDGFVDNPFHVPHFVLSHHIPEKVAKGVTSFTFVTGGIENALKQAKVVAGNKSVTVMGGANTAQQFIRAGLIDEIQIHIVPILLGEGIRLFDYIGIKKIDLENTRVIVSPTATHLRFRVIRNKGEESI